MVTDTEHIEALRRRLMNKQKDKEAELREIQEMIRVLGEAPKVLTGKESSSSTSTRREDTEKKTSVRYNMTFAKDIEDYVAALKFGEAININAMLKTLREEKGLQGKHDSNYAYAHSVLGKMVKAKKLDLKYEKGVGYFRSRGEDKNSELVASIPL